MHIENWKCSNCGEIGSINSAWRWTGEEPEHRCKDMHPQAGYCEAHPILRVWEIEDCDWVIAESAAEALKIATEYQGEYECEGEPVVLACPMDRPMSIHNDDTGETARKTMAEWIASNGRGWLCSENY